MATDHQAPNSMSLFTLQGERKYLNRQERKRFYKSLTVIEDESERTFCETIYWTGCRPSEALELDVMRVNIEDACLIFRTLKKHGKNKGKHFRIVPVPYDFMKRLDEANNIRITQRLENENQLPRLWRFGRQKGWRLIKQVMQQANIFGIRACARGLRHSFGIHAILCGIPETRLQYWLGHESLDTTAIYVQAIGKDDRIIASRMWL